MSNLVVSHIAWENSDNELIADFLTTMGINKIETTPFKILGKFDVIDKNAVCVFNRFWQKRNISIVSMQALLYGAPTGNLFIDTEAEVLLNHLYKVVDVAQLVGAKRLVFGSPVARQKKDLDFETALAKAAIFFKRICDYSHKRDIVICIEPNPQKYNCDFINNYGDALNLFESVNSPGFGVHLDTGGMLLEGEDPQEAILGVNKNLQHLHISNKDLTPLAQDCIPAAEINSALSAINYKQYISLEMKYVDDNYESFKKSVELLKEWFWKKA